MSDKSVAIITGAASGIGLALTKVLLGRGWVVVMVDMNAAAGEKYAGELGPDAYFKKVNVASWDEQAALFKWTFDKFGRIDFHAANAGIDDKDNLYLEKPEEKNGPLKPNLVTIDVDLIAPIYATKLATYYMRRNPKKGGCVVITSSAAGLYAFDSNPQYCAAKHALIGWVRSVGPVYGDKDNVRVNAICPAFVPTALAPGNLVEIFPKEHITPMSTIMKAFESYIDKPELNGQICECSQESLFYRKTVDYPNESQRWMQEESYKLWDSVYTGKEKI